MIDAFKANGGSPPHAVDISVEDQGSIYLLTGITESGGRWLDTDLDPEGQRFGWARGVEPRVVWTVVRGNIAASPAVRG